MVGFRLGIAVGDSIRFLTFESDAACPEEVVRRKLSRVIDYQR
jgi:hypothetical protein